MLPQRITARNVVVVVVVNYCIHWRMSLLILICTLQFALLQLTAFPNQSYTCLDSLLSSLYRSNRTFQYIATVYIIVY
jgi:hypothetical protein